MLLVLAIAFGREPQQTWLAAFAGETMRWLAYGVFLGLLYRYLELIARGGRSKTGSAAYDSGNAPSDGSRTASSAGSSASWSNPMTWTYAVDTNTYSTPATGTANNPPRIPANSKPTISANIAPSGCRPTL